MFKSIQPFIMNESSVKSGSEFDLNNQNNEIMGDKKENKETLQENNDKMKNPC